jgi:preprotein translocase subunit YajC
MFISPAFAQAAGGASAGSGFEAIMPLILIFVVFYFLLIRPQQKKMKVHKASLTGIRRGDKVVTGGGIIGKVIKGAEGEAELTIEIAKDVKVKVLRETVAHVIPKAEPVSRKKAASKTPKAANEDGDAGEKGKTSKGGLLRGILGNKKDT